MRFQNLISCYLTPILLLLFISSSAVPHSQQAKDPANPMVRINVIVTDSSNQIIRDLPQEKFRILQDKKPQTILYFSKDEEPIYYGLIMDNTASLKKQINEGVEAAKSIVRTNKPDDKAFVVSFTDDNVKMVKDATTDRQALLAAFDTLYIAKGQTRILDAVYASAENIGKSNLNGRRAIVLITDGAEGDSYYRKDEVLEKLIKNKVQVFAIGLIKDLDNAFNKRDKAKALLKSLASGTGGLAFFPKSVAELHEISKGITGYVRSQYILGYVPTDKPSKDLYKKVKVEIESAGTDKYILSWCVDSTVVDK